MTSSIRHLKPGQPRWNSDKHEFKSHNPFVEKDLISILFLACNNPELTRVCLDSTLQMLSGYSGEYELLFMENGNNEDNYKLFYNVAHERKKIIRSDNWGIMSAFNDLFAIARGEFCFIHENDFLNSNPSANILFSSISVLKFDQEVGSVYIRNIHDPNENWGYRKPEYLPYTCDANQNQSANITVTECTTNNGIVYQKANHPNWYNNNPCLIRKKIWTDYGPFNEPMVGSCPKHDETHFQHRTANIGYKGAYIPNSPYIHIGGARSHEFKSRR